jgi:hypothetical protein
MIRLRRSVCSAGTRSPDWSSARFAAANRQTAGRNFGFGAAHIDGSGRAQPGAKLCWPRSE